MPNDKLALAYLKGRNIPESSVIDDSDLVVIVRDGQPYTIRRDDTQSSLPAAQENFIDFGPDLEIVNNAITISTDEHYVNGVPGFNTEIHNIYPDDAGQDGRIVFLGADFDTGNVRLVTGVGNIELNSNDTINDTVILRFNANTGTWQQFSEI